MLCVCLSLAHCIKRVLNIIMRVLNRPAFDSMEKGKISQQRHASSGAVMKWRHKYSIQFNFICIALFTIQDCHKEALQRALA